MDELVYWLALQKKYWWFPPKKIESAIKELGSIEKFWYASEEYLINLGLKNDFVKEFIQYRESLSFERLLTELEEIRRKHITIIPYVYPEYPKVLKNVRWLKNLQAPRVLFHVGMPLSSMDLDRCIGVVGRRLCSSQASEVAYEVGGQLAKHGYITVSGLAVGVDSRAHTGAVDKGGLTIAVLPWLNPIYPQENEHLAERIKGCGCLLSECYNKPEGSNIKWRIVERNKIISGLSKFLVVVEAGEKGGTIRTAEMALGMKKKVFVFAPKGTEKTKTEGCVYLVKRGAVTFDSVDELINKINENFSEEVPKKLNLTLTHLTEFLNKK